MRVFLVNMHFFRYFFGAFICTETINLLIDIFCIICTGYLLLEGILISKLAF